MQIERRGFLKSSAGWLATAWALQPFLQMPALGSEHGEAPPGIDPEIWHALRTCPVQDTHEHLEEEDSRLARKLDFTELLRHYSMSDFVSAGMPGSDVRLVLDSETDLDRKWSLLEPYWDRVKNTAYLRAARISARRLYGVEDIGKKTYRTISDRMRAANKPGVVFDVMRNKCGIVCAQVNALENTIYRVETDPRIFLQDISGWKLLARNAPLDVLEQDTGIAPKDLDHYLQIIDSYFDRYAAAASAMKNQCAYQRGLVFDDVEQGDARRLYDKWLEGRRSPGGKQSLNAGELKALEDFQFNHMVRRAQESDLVVKIHTGYMAGNNHMHLDRLRPSYLESLLRRFPETRFDLFHMGFPYENELVAMAKHFTNVYADLTWAPIINPVASVEFVKRVLVSCPSHKLFVFGGDYGMIDPVYGHLEITRQVVGHALTQLVGEGHYKRPEALRAVRMVLHDNVVEAFQTERRQAAARALAGRRASAS